ncbi:hypothetical protein NDU88_009037 [Pleurodeles waltl]|uniref:Transmembrane protein 238 n=1 Tax=Pleurodeles waltl TaxID=8319 RepID=A0AAV7PTT8_PLEWA|nr:hypothetical protein NDU88_009037 [Pleurodeles waltl]
MRFGRCKGLFWLAVTFDLGGLALILVGIFANLQLDGRSFGEFLIYCGGIVVFFSLLWWLAWYSGNLEISLEDLQKEIVIDKPRSFKQLARKKTGWCEKHGHERPPSSLQGLEMPRKSRLALIERISVLGGSSTPRFARDGVQMHILSMEHFCCWLCCLGAVVLPEDFHARFGRLQLFELKPALPPTSEQTL